MTLRCLILAGSAEARRLSALLAQDPEVSPLASLAGATANPQSYDVPTRIGGFGGVEGLVRYLQANAIDAIVDATHPFATQISANAAAAARMTRRPLVRLTRAAWRPTGRVRWRNAASALDAAAMPPKGARAFLAVGGRSIEPFCARTDYWRAARRIDPPDAPPPFSPGDWIIASPPFAEADERALLKALKIDLLIAKNAGGEQGWAKLAAAADLGVPIILIDRPTLPRAETFETVEETIAALKALKNRCGERQDGQEQL
ncbi:MAG: cobalt-precorrin-6A reductase [Pseudomonadota bacterium]